ncbi:Type II inositol 1,4,5-trisphosphate 5-phosphatase [Allomyces javanicus]|nr:Type II inositol 1,4,5-trisphosphate 5-phosphatase [Allomyces javanicus]
MDRSRVASVELQDSNPVAAANDTSTWLHHGLKKRRGTFTTRKPVSVWIGTWNVGGAIPSAPLDHWILGRSLAHRSKSKRPPLSVSTSLSASGANPGSANSPDTLNLHDTGLISPLVANGPPRLELAHLLDGSESVTSFESLLSSASSLDFSVAASDDLRRDSLASTVSTVSSVTAAKPPLPPRPPAPPAEILAFGFQEVDVSTDVYFAHDPATILDLKSKIIDGLGPHLEKQYALVSIKQLAGMIVAVLAHESVVPHISEVESGYVGCGIMGVLGNKGAVAIRFKVFDTRICMVNSHLAADQNQVERRDSDFHEICRRLMFKREDGSSFGAPYDQDETMVFWFGDLNYRLESTYNDVLAGIKASRVPHLLQRDQLGHSIRTGRAFAGFQEAPITFHPTYKFDPGTNRYDTSEKQRTPAWCDRILWRHPSLNVTPVKYRSHMRYGDSDHKPVSAILTVETEVIDQDKYTLAVKEVLREHDKWENEFIPEASVSEQLIDLGEVKVLKPVVRTVELRNTGKIPVSWFFASARPTAAEDDTDQWMWTEPSKGFLEPGERQSITIRILVSPVAARSLNHAGSALNDILILRLEHGRDFFISVEGRWLKTCLAQSLQSLCDTGGAVRVDAEPQNGASSEEPRHSVPQELQVLSKFILAHAMDVPARELWGNNGEEAGDEAMLESVLDSLDTGAPLDATRLAGAAGARSVTRVMLLMLEYLEVPVIPDQDQEQFVASVEGSPMLEAVAQLPVVHRATLLHLLELCESLIDKQGPDTLAVLAEVFGPLVMRVPLPSGLATSGSISSVAGLNTAAPTTSPSKEMKRYRAKIQSRQLAFARLVQTLQNP